VPFHRPLPSPREPPADLATSPFNSCLMLANYFSSIPA
jgi:hypothetical protein